jgi:hypothetical protein
MASRGTSRHRGMVHGAHPGLIRPLQPKHGHRFYNFTPGGSARIPAECATFLLAPFQP